MNWNKVATGVEVGVDVSSIIVALVAWLWPRHGKSGPRHFRNMEWN
jgi:hypothetical protein